VTAKVVAYMLTPMPDGSTLLHDARLRAGLSIRSLASLAGVSASTVSRIESAQMDATIGMLERLLSAAGHDLEISATRTQHPTIASLANAWRSSSRGDVIDWTRLRAFLDYLYLHPAETPLALATKPAKSGSPLLDNLLAGIAETHADESGLPRPTWTKTVASLKEPWASPGTPRQQEQSRLSTPQPLALRGITLARASLWRDRADV
jgi:transcriptional regulator with XRE-family HTH domain